MKAEDLLRRYLEQRREMGETELVLDGLSVDEVMKLVGIKRGGRAALERARPLVTEADGKSAVGESPSAGWRDALRATGTLPESPRAGTRAPEPVRAADAPPHEDVEDAPPKARPIASAPAAPPGLVVGSADGEPVSGGIGAATDLAQLAELIRRCTRCDLYKTATNAVPGEGNPHAGFMCIGEAPGAQED
ncbi:MAG TPA: hypothetical protein VK617_15145, partial [Gemmatimonadaceae bacterium]|nr:hypothetical protein [Gemmatimonadaceae bacterium]